jgi:predicted  nucleic acid-binding Zn-ribbon protein
MLVSRGKAVSDGAVFFLLNNLDSVREVVKMREELKRLEAMLVERDNEMAALKREKEDLENLRTNRQHEIANLHSLLHAREGEIQNFRSSADRRAEDLDREVEDLKATLVERDDRIVSLNRENEHLRNLRTEIANLHSQLRDREEETQKLRSADRKARDLARELDAYRDAFGIAEQARRTLQEETVTLRRQVADTNNRLQQLQHEHTSNLDMLKVRTTELKLAQKFLNTADPFAGAEVTRMVENLNNQILDWAAHLADKLVHSVPRVANVDAAELEKGRDAIRASLGDQFVSLLQASRGANDPEMVLQIALQASLTWFSCVTISQWHQDANLDGFLKSMYYAVQRLGMLITFDERESY